MMDILPKEVTDVRDVCDAKEREYRAKFNYLLQKEDKWALGLVMFQLRMSPGGQRRIDTAVDALVKVAAEGTAGLDVTIHNAAMDLGYDEVDDVQL